MRTKLSSGWTIALKTIAPIAFSAVTLVVIVSVILFPRESWPDGFGFLLVNLPVTAFVIWWATRLKWVSVDDQNLYIAGWFRELLIPLTDVDNVDEFLGGYPVIVRLKSPSAFGCKILFVPPWVPFLILTLSTHPITQNLRERVKRANNAMGAI